MHREFCGMENSSPNWQESSRCLPDILSSNPSSSTAATPATPCSGLQRYEICGINPAIIEATSPEERDRGAEARIHRVGIPWIPGNVSHRCEIISSSLLRRPITQMALSARRGRYNISLFFLFSCHDRCYTFHWRYRTWSRYTWRQKWISCTKRRRWLVRRRQFILLLRVVPFAKDAAPTFATTFLSPRLFHPHPESTFSFISGQFCLREWENCRSLDEEARYSERFIVK